VKRVCARPVRGSTDGWVCSAAVPMGGPAGAGVVDVAVTIVPGPTVPVPDEPTPGPLCASATAPPVPTPAAKTPSTNPLDAARIY
jgi:hypothetical protein